MTKLHAHNPIGFQAQMSGTFVIIWMVESCGANICISCVLVLSDKSMRRGCNDNKASHSHVESYGVCAVAGADADGILAP